MRWMCRLTAFSILWAATTLTAAGEPAGAIQATPVNHARIGALCGPPCSAPGGYATLPGGCCECQPNCCDNAWATYCQEKHKWDEFWSKVGTGAYRHQSRLKGPLFGKGAQCPPCDASELPAGAIESAPAAPVAPTPAPSRPVPLPPKPEKSA
jgi:hypothetical protein